MSKTYKLPFDTTVRVSSQRRFILVREDRDGKPSIIRRSDDRAKLERIYDPATDYLIDQERGFVTFSFNGKTETYDGIDGRHLYFVEARNA